MLLCVHDVEIVLSIYGRKLKCTEMSARKNDYNNIIEVILTEVYQHVTFDPYF